MTKVGTKKPRGKPFVKGEDPRRVHGKSGAQVNEFTREMKRCLLDAAEQSGNRMVAISNERCRSGNSSTWNCLPACCSRKALMLPAIFLLTRSRLVPLFAPFHLAYVS